jgi:DNA-binding transcriptional regulator YbjK
MVARAEPGRSGSDRRTAIADAAIDLLAEGGTRALTHRMVDRRLGIPEGSTSTYHRTRKELVHAAAARVMERELEAIAATSSGLPSDAGAVDIITALVLEATSPERRSQTLARYILFTEAANNEDLRDALRINSGVAFREATVRLLELAGARDPEHSAPALSTFINGLVLGQLVFPDAVLSGDDLRRAIAQFLESC